MFLLVQCLLLAVHYAVADDYDSGSGEINAELSANMTAASNANEAMVFLGGISNTIDDYDFYFRKGSTTKNSGDTYDMCRYAGKRCVASSQTCAPGFGSSTVCDRRVCEDANCVNGYCRPQLQSDNEHQHKCVCEPGWRGGNCDVKCNGEDLRNFCPSSECLDMNSNEDFDFLFFLKGTGRTHRIRTFDANKICLMLNKDQSFFTSYVQHKNKCVGTIQNWV